ncbi:MAG: hypothetical protein WD577_05235 [Bacteroidales bacterium]
MLKTRYNVVLLTLTRTPRLIFSIVIFWSGLILFAQPERSTVSFFSNDSLLITADEFITSDSFSYLILIHEQGSSRGEFNEILNRFQKMNYNCLAVDVRNGGNSNFIPNETAKRARNKGKRNNCEAVEADILAAIDYAYEKSGHGVILLGAGANGSLVLKAAKEQDVVNAAIALSPGEFFLPLFSVENTISGIQKPLLITANRTELPYIEQIMSNVEEEYKTIFVPENSEGERGSAALVPDNPSYTEYWLAILLFFKDLQVW